MADGLRVAARTGERFWEPELLRLRGELQLLQDPEAAIADAEQTFRMAIKLARSQGAMLLALRAAVSLGRMLRCTGRAGEARSVVLEMSQSVDQSAGRDMDEANALLGEMETQ